MSDRQTLALIALGSNLGDRKSHLDLAVASLSGSGGHGAGRQLLS